MLVMKTEAPDHLTSWQNFTKHPFDLEQLLSIFRQMTAAVAHMHEHQLIFRDLYPKRLHLRDGLIKWSLLGMPYNFKKLNKCPTFSGHLIYSAPEILESGQSNFLSDKADIWSLGACLYYIITKKEPFSDQFTLNNPL